MLFAYHSSPFAPCKKLFRTAVKTVCFQPYKPATPDNFIRQNAHRQVSWFVRVKAVFPSWIKRLFKRPPAQQISVTGKPDPDGVEFIEKLYLKLDKVSNASTEPHAGITNMQARAAHLLVGHCMNTAARSLKSGHTMAAGDALFRSIAVADEWDVKTDEFWKLANDVADSLNKEDTAIYGYAGPHGRYYVYWQYLYVKVTENSQLRPPGRLCEMVLEKVAPLDRKNDSR
jgi:hypothetical protein